ncbi:methionyl-tRNA formyltransferase [Thalassobacillus devorans]|uniref:methionyl-tRNA formyltransferase n=1 Tax=Thalassobacillus devorans TaxID=279813 RepID=UPI00048B669F|nr:methionyl-tRNA formyltransferase [Thalassobacillus devorans]
MTKIAFMGTPDFAVPVLEQLIADRYEIVLAVSQPDRPKGRKKVMTPPPVKTAAEKHGISVFQPEKIRDEYEKVLAYEPDLIVTAAFGQILPKALLEAPKHGCINVHASLLPELRGGAPIHYAILQGKEETGVTIMYMVEKLDAGDILSQIKVAIQEEDHVGTLHDKLAKAGAQLLHETLPALLAGEIEPKRQDEALVTFASNIKREQEEIDWNADQVTVYNQIRGLHPWPVAYTHWRGRPMKIWWGEKTSISGNGEPGVIVDIQEDGFVVTAGDGKGLKITELQPTGKKRMSAVDFLNGAGSQLERGEKLGKGNE